MATTHWAAAGEQIARLYRGEVATGLGDEDLLLRFVERRAEPAGEAAFAAIVGRHGGMIRSVCRRIVRDEHAADDAVQATFLVLARRAGSVRIDGSLGAWLRGVAVRVAIRALRQRTARRVGSLDGIEPVAPVVGESPMERADLFAAIEIEVARLPGRYRVAVVLCHFEGLAPIEAARRLRLPEGTVRSRLHRARGRLRLGLARRGFAPAGLGFLALNSADAALPAALAARTVGLATLAGPGIAGRIIPAGIGALLPWSIRRIAMQSIGWLLVLAAGVGLSGDDGRARGVGPSSVRAVMKADPDLRRKVDAIIAEWSAYEANYLRRKDPGELVDSPLPGGSADEIPIARPVLGPVAVRAREKVPAHQARYEKFVDCNRRLLDLAESSPRDPAALDAMLYPITQFQIYMGESRGPYAAQIGRAADLLLTHHGDSLRIAPPALTARTVCPGNDRLVNGYSEGAKSRATKGFATLALARYRVQEAVAAQAIQRGQILPGFYSDETIARLRASDRMALREDARRLFVKAIEEYGDIPYSLTNPGRFEIILAVEIVSVGKTIASEASEGLDSLLHLLPGKQAPEVAWQAGDKAVTFRDFKGKVVVLHFFDNEAERSRDEMIRVITRLAGPMRGRPLQLHIFARTDRGGPPMAIAFDPFWLNLARKARLPTDAELAGPLNIRSYPTTLVVDDEGVIRYKGVSCRYVDSLVEGLVAQAEARNPKR